MLNAVITIKVPILIALLIGSAAISGIITYQVVMVSHSTVSAVCVPVPQLQKGYPAQRSRIKPLHLREGDGKHY